MTTDLDQLGTPEIVLLRTEELAVFDNRKGRLSLIVHAATDEPGAIARAERRLDRLDASFACAGSWLSGGAGPAHP